jgi:hypothetical protein
MNNHKTRLQTLAVQDKIEPAVPGAVDISC